MHTYNYINTEVGGKYELIRLLGEGGMGAVYLGRHKLIGKLVAVKIQSEFFVADEGYVKRFYREAKAAASIHHPNVVDVLDIGVSQYGQPYIVMEYLVGEGLDMLLERAAPMDLDTAAAVIEPALSGLEQAHKVGIVHRDLKPENIFVVSRNNTETNTVKIIDFGISKVLYRDDATQLTEAGSLLGTPAYMSPEQVSDSKTLDHRSDIFSIGVILYELLAGLRPFQGNSSFEQMRSVLSDPPPDPMAICRAFPPIALPIVGRALEKDRENRFQSAEEMRFALESICDIEEGKAKLASLMDAATDTIVAMGDLGGNLTQEIDSQNAIQILAGMATQTVKRPDKPTRGLKRALSAATMFILFAALAGALGYIYFGKQLEKGIAAASMELPPLPDAAEGKGPVDFRDSFDRKPYYVGYVIASVSTDDSADTNEEDCAKNDAGCALQDSDSSWPVSTDDSVDVESDSVAHAEIVDMATDAVDSETSSPSALAEEEDKSDDDTLDDDADKLPPKKKKKSAKSKAKKKKRKRFSPNRSRVRGRSLLSGRKR